MKAFRAGAADVVLKEPDVVPYLRERVIEAAGEIKATADRNSLLEEVAETHEEFLRRLREVSHELLDHEDRASGRTSDDATTSAAVSVVLVDDNPEALEKLEKVLTAAEGWHFRAALSGGEALDVVTQMRPQIVIVKEDLPDLPGSMVVTTVKASAPEVLTLLYSPPGQSGRTGEVKLIDAGRVMTLVGSYSEAGQLVGPARRNPRGAQAEGARAPLPAGLPPEALRVPAALQRHQDPAQRRARPPQEEPLAAGGSRWRLDRYARVRVSLRARKSRAGSGRAGGRRGRSRPRRRRAPGSRRSRAARLYRRAWPAARRHGRWPARAPAAGRAGSGASGRCRRCPRPAGPGGRQSARPDRW